MQSTVRNGIFPLQRSPKIFRGYKCCNPSSTIERIERAFRRLRIKLSYQGRSFASAGVGIHSGIATIAGTAFSTNGKGMTRLLAKASAYAEFVERFSSIMLRGVIGERPDDALEAQFLNFSFLRQFSLLRRGGDLRRISLDELLGHCVKLTPRIRRAITKDFRLQTWVNAASIRNESVVSVPLKLIYHITGSNGLASGNTYEEAIAQALAEVIERHVETAWLVEGRSFPTIEDASITDPISRKYLNLLRSFGYHVIIKDLSLGKGYPAVGVWVTDPGLAKSDNPYLRRYAHRVRCRCSPVIVDALRICFLELLQGYTKKILLEDELEANRIFWEEWCGRDPGDCRKRDLPPWLGQRYPVRFCASAGKIAGTQRRRFSEMPDYSHEDARDDVMLLDRLLHRAGYEAVVIDYTHPILQFPVVQVIVPGLSDRLQHQDPRWLNDSGIQSYALSLEHNLEPFISNDAWMRNVDGIESLLQLLEGNFIMYGFEDQVKVENGSLWLFEFAYHLSVILRDAQRSLRYCRTFRAWGYRDQALYSAAMESYWEQLANTESASLARKYVGQMFGRCGERAVDRVLREVSADNALRSNPFRRWEPGRFSQNTLHHWISTFYYKPE